MANKIKILGLAGSLRKGSYNKSLLATAKALAPENVEIEVTSLPQYVSRGGEKLESALKYWKINVREEICLDVGSSTGGFSDCLLQNGAKKIYAVDVGYGQLHSKLRVDSRIRLFEKTHILKWQPLLQVPSVEHPL